MSKSRSLQILHFLEYGPLAVHQELVSSDDEMRHDDTYA
jgi:hypothetical protein